MEKYKESLFWAIYNTIAKNPMTKNQILGPGHLFQNSRIALQRETGGNILVSRVICRILDNENIIEKFKSQPELDDFLIKIENYINQKPPQIVPAEVAIKEFELYYAMKESLNEHKHSEDKAENGEISKPSF